MSRLLARFGLAVLIAVIAALIVRGSFFSSSPFVIAGQVAALALAFWARAAFPKSSFAVAASPKSRELVIRGPYRVIRHPMDAAALLLVWSSVLSHWSLVNGAIGTALLAMLIARVKVEKKALREYFPNYLEYSRKTKAFIPFVI